MSANDNGGPAFPTFTEQYHYGLGEKQLVTVQGGMTLRDYFAAKAIPSLLDTAMSLAAVDEKACIEATQHVATSAYMIADQMLKARQG